jgi:hypothetical protein
VGPHIVVANQIRNMYANLYITSSSLMCLTPKIPLDQKLVDCYLGTGGCMLGVTGFVRRNARCLCIFQLV